MTSIDYTHAFHLVTYLFTVDNIDCLLQLFIDRLLTDQTYRSCADCSAVHDYKYDIRVLKCSHRKKSIIFAVIVGQFGTEIHDI